MHQQNNKRKLLKPIKITIKNFKNIENFIQEYQNSNTNFRIQISVNVGKTFDRIYIILKEKSAKK